MREAWQQLPNATSVESTTDGEEPLNGLAQRRGSYSSDKDEENGSCRCCRIGSAICSSCVCLGLLALLGSVLSANDIMRRQMESTGSEAFGTETTVGSCGVGFAGASTSFKDVTVKNPPGFFGHFLTIRDGLLDTTFWSFFHHHVEVEEMAVDTVNVTMVQNDTILSMPNFVYIMNSLQHAKDREGPIQPPGFLGGRVSARLYSVDRVEMRNMWFLWDMRGALGERFAATGAPVAYGINKIVVKDIGKQKGGVPMEEVMQIMVNAVVRAGIHQAPANIEQMVLSALRDTTAKMAHLDFSSLHLDAGEGLKQVSKLIDFVGDRLHEANVTAATAAAVRAGAPASFGKGETGEALGYTLQAGADVGAEMADFAANSTAAWGETIAGHQKLSDTLEIQSQAFATALEHAKLKAKQDGSIGGMISDVINGSQLLGAKFGEATEKAATSMIVQGQAMSASLHEAIEEERRERRERAAAAAAVAGGQAQPSAPLAAAGNPAFVQPAVQTVPPAKETSLADLALNLLGALSAPQAHAPPA